MEKYAIEALSNVTISSVILYTIVLLFVGGGIYKFLEKYRKVKNTIDEKDKTIELHSEQINTLGSKVDIIADKVDQCIEAIDALRDEAQERDARRLRKGILQFADGLREGRKPSLDMYREIFESNKEYLMIINKTGIRNGFTEREMEYIEQNYREDYCSQ